MPKFIIKAHETFYYEREVEANSSEEALDIVKRNVLDWLDYETDNLDWSIDSVEEIDICPSCGYNESSEPCKTHKEKVDE
jgi:hypothetical protein